MPIRREDRKRYPEDWAQISHRIRFGRAGGRCEWCGAEHGRPHPETGSTVVLTTAHVHDPSPENVAEENLAALCQRCHLRLDAPYHRRRRRERLDLANGQGRLFD